MKQTIVASVVSGVIVALIVRKLFHGPTTNPPQRGMLA